MQAFCQTIVSTGNHELTSSGIFLVLDSSVDRDGDLGMDSYLVVVMKQERYER